MDMTDSSLKLSNPHHPLSHHHYNLSRTLLLRRSRHHYGHQYSRRNSANHADASTSHGKITPSCDEKLSFKLANHSKSDFGQHTGDLFSLFFCVCFNGFLVENKSGRREMRHLVIIYNNGCGVIIILLAYMTNETPIVSLFSRIQI